MLVGRGQRSRNPKIPWPHSTKDARKFLEKYKRVDIAIDAYYNDPNAFSGGSRRNNDSSGPSTSKLNSLFDKYKGALGYDSGILYALNKSNTRS